MYRWFPCEISHMDSWVWRPSPTARGLVGKLLTFGEWSLPGGSTPWGQALSFIGWPQSKYPFHFLFATSPDCCLGFTAVVDSLLNNLFFFFQVIISQQQKNDCYTARGENSVFGHVFRIWHQEGKLYFFWEWNFSFRSNLYLSVCGRSNLLFWISRFLL